ncbi:MAG: glycerol-3-phosphate 1-O-acyltransferase PlsY [Gemmatimonadetes bacterium]|nr:glycerol-3-phosphate 1-O-acyltransferase PlsY [Gemmatimonadota bacterium]
MIRLAAGLAIAYLAGSIPTAWIAGRARGVDLGKVGSGNYGATNAYRTLGAGPAAVVVVVDVSKGLLPVLLLPRWLPVEGVSEVAHQVTLAAAAVLGHVYSLFLGFRGGKGIGTAAGAYAAMAPWATLVATLGWGVVLAVTRVVSAASLTAAVALLIAVWAFGRETPLVVATTLLVAFVFWTHRENVRRLLRGEEKRIRKGGAG